MNVTSTEIETIVQVVLERLRDADLRSRVNLGTALGQSEEQSKDSQLGNALTIDESVVTLETLNGRLAGLESLIVDRRAIITPAVFDELRGAGVRLKRIDLKIGQVRSSASTGLQDADHRLLFIAQGSQRAVLGSLGEFTAESQNPAADVRRIAAHLNSGGKYAIWGTSTPYAALRASAVNASLAAVSLHVADDFLRAKREADPNTLILDATRWNPAQTAALARQVLESLR